MNPGMPGAAHDFPNKEFCFFDRGRTDRTFDMFFHFFSLYNRISNSSGIYSGTVVGAHDVFYFTGIDTDIRLITPARCALTKFLARQTRPRLRCARTVPPADFFTMRLVE